MGATSVALKMGAMMFRVLQMGVAIGILGIASYFFVFLSNHNTAVPDWVEYVCGIAAVTTLYAFVAFILVCCLGGKAVFAFIGLALDLIFGLVSAAVAYLTYGGNTNCKALPAGDNGTGNNSSGIPNVDPSAASQICLLYKTLFFLGLANFVLFLLSAILQYSIGRAHRRDKRKQAEKEEQKAAAGCKQCGGA